MKKLMMALVASVALVSAASAETKTYARYGAWENYAGTSEPGHTPMCGMSTSNSNSSMMLHVKWVNGNVRVIAFKNSWRIPDGTQIPVELGFDGNGWGATTAAGSTYYAPSFTMGMVEFGSREDSIKGFLDYLAGANKLTLRFTEGNETPWIANLNGSRPSVESFKACVRTMVNRGNGTQPYSNNTQPFGNGGTTQPFSTSPSTPQRTPGEESF